MVKTILLVEDDSNIATLLRLNLQGEGYQIVHEVDGDQAPVQPEEQVWSAMILDLVLPDVNDLEIYRRIRQMARYLLVIIISIRASKMHRVLGLEIGADDYLAKPFSLLELIVRVKALFRRQRAVGQNLLMDVGHLSCHGLSIDPLSREAKLRGEVVDLTPHKSDLLYYLVRYPGEVFPRPALLRQVWGCQHKDYEHTVNIHVNHLHSRIERDPAELDIILAAWGKGYRFAPMSQEVAP